MARRDARQGGFTRRDFLKWTGLAGGALLLPRLPSWVSAQAAGGSLNYGVDQEAVGLDPHIITAFSSFQRTDLLYNRLVRLDQNLNIEPDLAESWEVPDPQTYVFHLHSGVRFHNGREMTSADVKASFDRILDPSTGSPILSDLPIQAAEVIDPLTVRLRLQVPLASLLAVLTSNNAAIVPIEEVQRNGDLQRVAVGTGPFTLAEWVPDNFMHLERNPNYFRPGLPLLNEVTFRVIPDQASLLAGLRAGSLDMAQITDGVVVTQAQGDPNLQTVAVPGLNVFTFGFKTTVEPFTNFLVRQAMSLAIDRQAIVDAVAFGLGEPTGPLPVSLKEWALPPGQLPAYTRDVDRARQLLAAAGFGNGLSFKIMTSPTYEGGLAIAQVLQSQLRDIGVDAQLDIVEFGIYVDRWVNRDFEGIVELRSGGPDPDAYLFRMLHSQGAVNNFLFANADLDQLLNQGRSNVDQAQRKQIYDQAQTLIAEQAPNIFLFSPFEIKLLRTSVQGYRQVPDGSIFLLEETSLT